MSDSDTGDQLQTAKVAATGETHARTTASARGHELVLDEPDGMGGTDEGPNPIEYQLAALAGCLNVTAHQVARERDVELASFVVDVEGDFDPAVFMGKTDDGRAGIRDVRASVDIEADADADELRELFEAVERRCPISDTLQNESGLELNVVRR